jgi:hypothetical protein
MIASNVASGDEVTVVMWPWHEIVKAHAARGEDPSKLYYTACDDRPGYSGVFWRPLADLGQTWARGWDTEDARVLEATVLLQQSA